MLDTFQLLVELFCLVVLVSSAWQNPSMMITQCCMPTWAEWQHYANLNENTMPTWAEWEHYANLSWMRTLCCMPTWAWWKHFAVCQPDLNENTMLYNNLSWMKTLWCMPTWAEWEHYAVCRPELDDALLLPLPVVLEVLAEGVPQREEVFWRHLVLSRFGLHVEKLHSLTKPERQQSKPLPWLSNSWDQHFTYLTKTARQQSKSPPRC